MRPLRLAIICAGQGQQASLDFTALRPGALDSADYQLVWRSFSECVGGEFDHVWSALTQEQRSQNYYAQLGIVAWQVLSYLRYRKALTQIDWVLGYSVGELSAQAIAGSIPFGELAGLVRIRAQLMDQVAPNSKHLPCLFLLSERLPPQARSRRLASLERLGLKLAIHRSQSESIWGGPPEPVAQFLLEAHKASWGARAIDVRVPSHTSYLSCVVPLFREALSAASLHPPEIKILAGISAEPVRTIDEVEDALSLQLAQTIRWDECLMAMLERGVTDMLDLGPGQDQSRLVQALSSDIHILDVPNI
jgi:[acyl-carrier-protein] S-malonyltransferase